MDRRPTIIVSLVVTLALVMALPIGALAKGGRPTTEATNNLSVPTIMVGGGGFTGVTCPVDSPLALVPATGVPLTGYPIDPTASFFVQGVHKWQAQCYATTTVVPVTAEWGDNLSGDARLKTGSPIRVELGLFNATGSAMDGYDVVKLDPNALDRESPYGTLATSDGVGGFFATAKSYTKVRVFDGMVTLSIRNVDTGTYVVQPGTKATAEINSTGNVVYGYNLRVTAAGDYEISYVTPSVTVTGTDAGDYTADSVTLVIEVMAGGSGGGGKPR